MEWVEVKGRTVEVAVEAALAELGLASVDLAEVEVIQQPDKGFLGIGRSDAVVRVKAKPKKRKRRRKPQEGREGSRGGDGRKRQGSQQQRRQQVEDRVLENQREPNTSRRTRRSHGALSGRRKPWTVMRYRLMMPPKRRWTIV